MADDQTGSAVERLLRGCRNSPWVARSMIFQTDVFSTSTIGPTDLAGRALRALRRRVTRTW
jgi:hypothetical protein